jgi:hypothetical protein
VFNVDNPMENLAGSSMNETVQALMAGACVLAAAAWVGRSVWLSLRGTQPGGCGGGGCHSCSNNRSSLSNRSTLDGVSSPSSTATGFVGLEEIRRSANAIATTSVAPSTTGMPEGRSTVPVSAIGAVDPSLPASELNRITTGGTRSTEKGPATYNVSQSARRLAWTLRVIGTVDLLACWAVFAPRQHLQQMNDRLGLAPLPDLPIVIYLAQTTSLFYVGFGVLLWLLSGDVERYLPVIRGIAILGMIGGGIMVAIDLTAGLPTWWVWLEGPCCIALGCLMYALLPRRQASAVDVDPAAASFRSECSVGAAPREQS